MMENINNIPENFVYNSEYLNIACIGDFIIGKDLPQIIVINLINRHDRKERIINELTKHKLPFSFYTCELHPDSVRGCLESHVNIIKWANVNKYKQICIFEDDVIIQEDLGDIAIPGRFSCEHVLAQCDTPKIAFDFDMLYLGGLCTQIYKSNNDWVKGRIYCNHAYIIRETVYQKIIDGTFLYEKELDRFYTENIHTNGNCYMTIKQFVIQHDGWSDIDRKMKWADFKWPQPGDRFMIP